MSARPGPASAIVSSTDREGFAAFMLRARAAGIEDMTLMSAIESVPRRQFMDAEYHHLAMAPRTIPIACGETLEGLDLQARIIHALHADGVSRVLEIGTGTGFTACVLSRLAKRVYTLERYRTLQQAAAQRIRHLGVTNVISLHTDGSSGSQDGPFDRIVSWNAFPALPRHFVEQLVSGGSMICAIGEADEPQVLVRLTKTGSRFEREDIGTVRFQLIKAGIPRIL